MSKFRTKPVVKEALQWTGHNGPEVTAFLSMGPYSAAGYAKGEYVDIGTLEGLMVASPGDWIIKGVAGEFYPCKPDVFAATYEAIEQDGKTAGPEAAAQGEARSDPPSSPVAGGGEELKPCPMCGKAVELTRHKGSDETGERWDYLAIQCQAKDHLVMCDAGDTVEEVIAAWNRRPLLSSPRVEEVRRLREALERISTHNGGVTYRGQVDLMKEIALAALSPPQGEGI